MLKVIIGAAAAIVIIGMALYFWRRGGWTLFHQKMVGCAVIGYAVYLATLTGTAWSLLLPGLSPIGAGAATGAFIGVVVSGIVGTLGVATGGLAIAAGVGTLAAIFGGVGAASGWVGTLFSGGYGLRKVSYPLVHWAFWVPLLLIGAYLLWNSSRLSKPNPPVLDEED